jgi:hypothetical protein
LKTGGGAPILYFTACTAPPGSKPITKKKRIGKINGSLSERVFKTLNPMAKIIGNSVKISTNKYLSNRPDLVKSGRLQALFCQKSQKQSVQCGLAIVQ